MSGESLSYHKRIDAVLIPAGFATANLTDIGRDCTNEFRPLKQK
jgi:hypothetical protein